MATNTSKRTAPVAETFHGYIETTRDSLLLFEACKRDMLPRIKRRLQDKERHLIRSGTIFCFDEKESGVKRWTDGLVWSPSRILGNFLIYRELDDKKVPRSRSADINATITLSQEEEGQVTMKGRSNSSGYIVAPDFLRRQREKALIGSLKNSYRFKRNGLVKKSMSLIVDGVQQHIVSYYNKEDVLSGKLRTPSSFSELSSLEVSPGFRLRENFRIPIYQQQYIEDCLSADDGYTDAQAKRTSREHSVSSKSPVYETSLLPKYCISPVSSVDSNGATSQYCISVEPTSNHSQNSLYSLPPVTRHSSTSSSIRSYPTTTITSEPNINKELTPPLMSGLPQNIFSSGDISYHQHKNLNASPLHQKENSKPHYMQNKVNDKLVTATTYHLGGVNGVKDQKETHLSHSISTDENFSNCNKQARMNFSTEHRPHYDHNTLVGSGGNHHYSSFQNHDFGQNPHQHLFSSSSFHAINHASIIPSRTNELITTNSFMVDMNILLGTGWNDFELQM